MTPLARIARAIGCALTVVLVVSAAHAGALRALHADGETVWAVGDAGTVLVSRDAGQSWTAVDVPVPADFRAVAVEGETVRLLGGQAVPGHPDARGRAVILRSDDGGETFTQAPAPPGGALYGGAFQGPAAVVFGEASPDAPGGLWRTVTGGRMWTAVESAQNGYLLGGDFRGIQLGYVVGGGQRVMSVRGLAEPQLHPPEVPSQRVLRAAALADGGTCWAAGDDGLLLRSRPGDLPWLPQKLPLPAATGRLADLETVCASGESLYAGGGLLAAGFRSEDAGASWKCLAWPLPGPVHAMATAGDALLAAGDAGRIWRSTDRGESWTRVRGADRTDVLFIVSPADHTVYPAVVAHALAGADVAVAFATRSDETAGAPPDQAPRAAAVEAGASGVTVFHSFPSPAATADETLTHRDVLDAWSRALDAPATDEMLRHMVAAIRLYRPRVLAVGPDGHEATGPAAECHLVSRLAQVAAERAGRADAFAELARVGLAPWSVQRVFVGLPGNERWARPWRPGPAAGPARGDVSIDASAFPVGAETCIELLAQRAVWRLPGTGAMDRPAALTGYRCDRETQGGALFTSGLAPHSLRARRVDESLGRLASATTLRFAALRGESRLATVLPAMLRAAEQADDEAGRVLAADRILLTWCGLLDAGRLPEAGRAERMFLRVGRAHPLHERVNVSALARAVSAEWRAQLALAGPQRPFSEAELQAAVETFEDWSAWSHAPAGRMLHAKALLAAGRGADAREVLRQLADGPYPPAWRRRARLELSAAVEDLPAEDRPRVLKAKQINVRGTIDGRLDEPFWSSAPELLLLDADGRASAGPLPVSVQAVRASALVVLAVRLQARVPKHWQLDVAVDNDRDGWTQLLVQCDTRGRRRVRLLTRDAPDAELEPSTVALQATEDSRGGYIFEMAIPVASVGGGLDAAAWGLQLRATPQGPGRTTRFYVQPQDDPRLLPHRYGLLKLPPAGAPPTQPVHDENP
jgi:photosystem II stability/assembly factor-like uncharacterized protein